MTLLRTLCLCCFPCWPRLRRRLAPTKPRLRDIIAKFATAKSFSATAGSRSGTRGDRRSRRRDAACGALRRRSVFRKSDRAVFIGKEAGETVQLLDPLTGEDAGEAAKAEVTKIKVNNALRRVIRDVVGALTLGSADPAVRLAAADTMFKTPTADAIEPLDAAIAKETGGQRQDEARAGARLRRCSFPTCPRPTSSPRST